jgi:hypothetical protein
VALELASWSADIRPSAWQPSSAFGFLGSASRATFYLYFESKAAVLQAVMRKLQLREE